MGRNMMTDAPPEPMHKGEPLFMERERLEVRKMIVVTEDNVLAVAKHFKWVVGHTDDGKVALYQPERAERKSWPKAVVGDRLTEHGSQIHDDGWRPRGTYTQGGIRVVP